jgi:hypothetical protein
MPPMPKLKATLVFAAWFGLIYGLLIAPWPEAKPLYAHYFRGLGQRVLESNSGRRLLRFEPLDDPGHKWPPNFDTGIILANRDLLDAGGNGQKFMLAVDAWQMGWAPTAFLVALTMATPIPWRRKRWALFWGWFWVQGFIVLTLGIFIWNESTRLYLVTLTPFWKGIANQVEELALSPVGPSFFASALIWMLVAFRRQDLAGKP